MVNSMTGFAGTSGASQGYAWTWDIRSVNARGLDIRLRLPDGYAALEQPLRAAVQKRVSRGNVTINLRLAKDSEGAALNLDAAMLDAVLLAMRQIEEAARSHGVTLAAPSSADILGQREIFGAPQNTGADKSQITDLKAGFEALLAAFCAMRADEGAALNKIINGQLDEIDRLTGLAARVADTRRDELQQAMKTALNRILEHTDQANSDRLEQELALIAVKADVTEEIDRLAAHVQAARSLLADDGPVGRKLDFLTQEFNREANTLCSKSQSKELTRVGLDLKAAIDQMREQVQNVE